jgi:hypothetical protein
MEDYRSSLLFQEEAFKEQLEMDSGETVAKR